MRNSQPLMYERISHRLDRLSHTHGPSALRISIGVVFLWFGALKCFPNVSPAETIAVDTLKTLSLGLVPARALVLCLAAFEIAVGMCFLCGAFRKVALPLLVVHMLGTGLPFFFFPSQLFDHCPLIPSLLGQYILKNIIILGAAIVLRPRWR